jgi:potassium-transporting ATPase KdpC subunit
MRHLLIALGITLVLGLAYPLAMTGAAQVLFPTKADGDPALIAREYPDDSFQPRPSVTGYAADATFFNNQGPNQRALADQMKGWMDDYLDRERAFTPGLAAEDVPPDAVTSSASGVDPHISPDNAEIQANRVAAERGIPLRRVLDLVDDATTSLGPPSVNVVELNEALR